MPFLQQDHVVLATLCPNEIAYFTSCPPATLAAFGIQPWSDLGEFISRNSFAKDVNVEMPAVGLCFRLCSTYSLLLILCLSFHASVPSIVWLTVPSLFFFEFTVPGKEFEGKNRHTSIQAILDSSLPR